MKKILLIGLITSCLSINLHAQDLQPTRTVKPFVLGTTEEIHSRELGENRILNIYLPEGYNAKDTVSYPVIYLLDGAADEDFIHITGIIQYFNFSWINTVPKSIVVGIANVNRRRDFTFMTTQESDKKILGSYGGSGKFISFLEKEVQPYVEKYFKTTNAKTLIGESLGGLLATEILFTKPSLFSTYIIVSPSLWWDNASLLQRKPKVLEADFKKNIAVYIGVGKEGLVPGPGNHIMEDEAEKLANKIKNGQNKTIKVFFDYLPNENHATVTHPAVFNAFRLLNPAPASPK